MRRTHTLCRAALPVAAAALLLTACGGSGNDKAASSSSKASSSASETSADAAGSDFCVKAAGIDDKINAAVENLSDPSSIPEAMKAAATEIRAIEPPPEIASDWNALASGVEQLAATFANVDFTDPQALATLEQKAQELQGASTNVEKYIADKCDLGTASPSS